MCRNRGTARLPTGADGPTPAMLYSTPMRTYIAAAVIAAVTCAFLTPLAKWVAHRVGALSYPGARHIHRAVVPRLGGTGIYLGLIVGIYLAWRLDPSIGRAMQNQAWLAVGLAGGATAIMILGAVDDIRGVPAATKLVGQVLVAVLAFACGFRIQNIWLPGLGFLPMGIFSLPVTLVWIVGIVNAINLIDGLDGLAAGVVLFAACTNFVVAWLSFSPLVALLMASTIGSLLGFLLFNFNPARIFMGDSGSYLLGYVLATAALVGSQKTSTAVSLLVPCLALGVPIFDTLFSIVRRFLERRPIFSPDRGHLHHRLIDLGLTHRRAVLTIYAVSAIFSITAIALWLGKEWEAGLALLVASLVFFALVRSAGYFEYLRRTLRQRARVHSPIVHALRKVLVELPLQFAKANSEEELLRILRGIGEAIDADRVEFRSTSSPPASTAIWTGQASLSPQDLVTLAFPVGDEENARAQVVFVMARSDGATPDCEVLLLLAVDMYAQALRTLGSPLLAKTSSTAVAPAQPSLDEPVQVRFAERRSHG